MSPVRETGLLKSSRAGIQREGESFLRIELPKVLQSVEAQAVCFERDQRNDTLE